MWRYQAIKDKDGEVGIHELYEIEGDVYWTEDAIEAMSEDAEGLKWVLTQMLEDLEKYGVKTEEELNDEGT